MKKRFPASIIVRIDVEKHMRFADADCLHILIILQQEKCRAGNRKTDQISDRDEIFKCG